MTEELSLLMADSKQALFDEIKSDAGATNGTRLEIGRAIGIMGRVQEGLTTLRAQNAALQTVASAAQIAAEELEYFVDFAVRQCEFEGDEVAGYAAVKAVRNALAQVAK